MDENAENSAQEQHKRVIGRPFQPGQSGNPKGKPKGTISITQEIKRQLRKRDPKSRKTWLEIYVSRTISEALKNPNTQAAKLILNYVDGLPKQQVEVGGQGGGPVPIRFVFDGVEHTEPTADDME